jgi:hypothetical protein
MPQGGPKLGAAAKTSDPVANKKHKSSSAPSAAHQSRKAVPQLAAKDSSTYGKHQHNITTAIKKRVEELMAGRLVHEGGSLSILTKPKNVDIYVNSAAKVSKKAAKDLQNSSLARRARQKKDTNFNPNNNTSNVDSAKASSSNKNKSARPSEAAVKKRKLDDLGLDEEAKAATTNGTASQSDSEEELERYLNSAEPGSSAAPEKASSSNGLLGSWFSNRAKQDAKRREKK